MNTIVTDINNPVGIELVNILFNNIGLSLGIFFLLLIIFIYLFIEKLRTWAIKQLDEQKSTESTKDLQ